MSLIVTDWVKYRHGVYRRVGDSMEIYCHSYYPTMVTGFFPAENAGIYRFYKEIFNKYKWFIKVKVKGWETEIVTRT